jgi:hypothetical protein
MNERVPRWVQKAVVGFVVLVVIAAAARSKLAERFVFGMIHGPDGTHTTSVVGGRVTVAALGKWRVHTGYRWVMTCAGKSVTGFVLEERVASVAVGGAGAVGAVGCEVEGSFCTGPVTRAECVPFREVVGE